MNKLKSGFTLIEILIVIAIIGVLSVSLVPNIAGAPAKARDLSKKQAVMQADAAMQAYIVSKGRAVNIARNDGAGAATICLKPGGVGVGVQDKWKNLIFEGEMPSATTGAAQSNDNCIDADGTIYPRYTVNAAGLYRFEIKVESAASASEGRTDIFWTGTLAP